MSGDISIAALTPVNWVLTGTAIILSVGRFAIRWKLRGRLYSDDAAHLVAVLALIAFSTSFQISLETAVDLTRIVDGTVPKPADFDGMVSHYRRYQNAVSFITLYITLWSVKITFMLFYRMLFNVNKTFRVAWWIVLVFTVGLFWVPIVGLLTYCGPIANSHDNEKCLSDIAGERTVLEYSCAIQVFTDLIIMALPLSMLRQIRISTSQKLGLALIFSIALVTVALDIARTVESITGSSSGRNGLYCILEATFTVIISCLPVYRGLAGYVQKKRTSATASGGGGRSCGISMSLRRLLYAAKQRGTPKASSGTGEKEEGHHGLAKGGSQVSDELKGPWGDAAREAGVEGEPTLRSAYECYNERMSSREDSAQKVSLEV